jgi:hypothetical protein
MDNVYQDAPASRQALPDVNLYGPEPAPATRELNETLYGPAAPVKRELDEVLYGPGKTPASVLDQNVYGDMPTHLAYLPAENIYGASTPHREALEDANVYRPAASPGPNPLPAENARVVSPATPSTGAAQSLSA